MFLGPSHLSTRSSHSRLPLKDFSTAGCSGGGGEDDGDGDDAGTVSGYAEGLSGAAVDGYGGDGSGRADASDGGVSDGDVYGNNDRTATITTAVDHKRCC